MNKWYDNFDDLYALYDETDPCLYVENYEYEIEHEGDENNWRKLSVAVYRTVKDKNNPHDKKMREFVEKKYLKNSFDFINHYVLVNGKTLAQMMCDGNGWDYTILPVYPKWLTPLLGDIETAPLSPSKEEYNEILRNCNKITDYLWNKDIDVEGLKMHEDAVAEVKRKQNQNKKNLGYKNDTTK